MIEAPSAELVRTLCGILLALTAGSCVRLVALRNSSAELRRKRLRSLMTWWILAVCVSTALLTGRLGMCVLMAAAGALALREYIPLVVQQDGDRLASASLYVLLVLNYGMLLTANVPAWSIGMPLLILFLPSVCRLWRGEPSGYTQSVAALVCGGLLLIYAFSHVALLFALPETSDGPTGPAGWFLFLVVLTETNDIAQALIGRRFGAHKRHRITPAISPNKTWEGFLGGLGVTAALSVLLAPWLTTLPLLPLPIPGMSSQPSWLTPLVTGLGIALLGFLGDINMSAVKRDAGVKDGSQLLPGMGGMIDRIDSLTFTAPAFVWFVTAIA